MADITVNGLGLPASSTVTVVIRPDHPGRPAATAAAEHLITALTGRQPVTMTDWDNTVTVATGLREARRAGTAPTLTADQQLTEDLAAVYRAALVSEAVAEHAGAVYDKLLQALRGLIETAWGLRTATARELARMLADDSRPVWAILHERKGVPLDVAA